MDYSIADRAARRNGPNVITPPPMADESLIADPRTDVRSTALVELRLQELLGQSPLPNDERWDHCPRASSGAIALEMVGEPIDPE